MLTSAVSGEGGSVVMLGFYLNKTFSNIWNLTCHFLNVSSAVNIYLTL